MTATIRIKKRHKYNATRTFAHGHWFQSKKEAKRYSELLLLEKAGEVADIQLQPEYKLYVNGILIGTYKADFKYFELACEDWITEDVKGKRTELYRWKKKHVEAQYGIKIVEI